MENNAREVYGQERFCPAYDRTIDFELCYESTLCLALELFKESSVPELFEIKDIEAARKVCKECSYSNME